METFTKEAQVEAVEAQAETTEAMQPAETITKAEHEAALLKERQIISRHTARIKELESKTQLSAKQEQELATLTQRTVALDEKIDAWIESQSGVEESAPQTYSQILQRKQAKRMQDTPKPQVDAGKEKEYASLNLILAKKSIDPKSPEVLAAVEVYNTEGYEAALAYLLELPNGKVKSTETAEQMTARIREEQRQEVLKEYGLNPNSVDTATSRGKGSGHKPSLEEMRKTPAAEVKKKFASGEWKDK